MKIMKYTIKITLYGSYFDINGRLTAKSILTIFQDIASIHAEEIGVGYSQMLEKNLYWVLSRVKFDILKMPHINQTVIVETWPHAKGKIDFDRDMRILSEGGDALIIATSKWCVIDTVKRMLQRTDEVNYNGEPCFDVNYEERFGKIILPNLSLSKKFVYNVGFCDLDCNQHMNNTNYANLVLNAIENKKISHFEINYISECKLGDKIDISITKGEKGEYVMGSINQRTVFNAYVK